MAHQDSDITIDNVVLGGHNSSQNYIISDYALDSSQISLHFQLRLFLSVTVPSLYSKPI